MHVAVEHGAVLLRVWLLLAVPRGLGSPSGTLALKVENRGAESFMFDV